MKDRREKLLIAALIVATAFYGVMTVLSLLG
jgi:hypothetical protein